MKVRLKVRHTIRRTGYVNYDCDLPLGSSQAQIVEWGQKHHNDHTWEKEDCENWCEGEDIELLDAEASERNVLCVWHNPATGLYEAAEIYQELDAHGWGDNKWNTIDGTNITDDKPQKEWAAQATGSTVSEQDKEDEEPYGDGYELVALRVMEQEEVTP